MADTKDRIRERWIVETDEMLSAIRQKMLAVTDKGGCWSGGYETDKDGVVLVKLKIVPLQLEC